MGRTNLLQPENLCTPLVAAVYIYLLTIFTLAGTRCSSFGSMHSKHSKITMLNAAWGRFELVDRNLRRRSVIRDVSP